MRQHENVHSFSAVTLSGESIDLSHYMGKVLLVINTASECVFTPQYKDLEALYSQFRERGFEVLGFPCNQFGKQEPGTAEEIGAFCERDYGVSFPMFAKVDVNGSAVHPLFRHLKRAAPGLLGTQAIKWNFTKFLIRKDGSVHKRYAPQTKPDALRRDIESLLRE